MKDTKFHLARLRDQVAEFELIRDKTTDPAQRDEFKRLAQHFEALATGVERAIAA
jgi:HAMP domain-containing protein